MQNEPFDPAHVPEGWTDQARAAAVVRARQRRHGLNPSRMSRGAVLSIVGVVAVALALVCALGGAGWVVSLLIVGAAMFIYLLPTLVASSENHRNLSALFALNLLLGWTIVGWVAALVWALYKSK